MTVAVLCHHDVLLVDLYPNVRTSRHSQPEVSCYQTWEKIPSRGYSPAGAGLSLMGTLELGARSEPGVAALQAECERLRGEQDTAQGVCPT